jgi:hypothetical protein
MDGPLFETFKPELEMAEARLLAGVMLADKFQGGRGSLDAGLYGISATGFISGTPARRIDSGSFT